MCPTSFLINAQRINVLGSSPISFNKIENMQLNSLKNVYVSKFHQISYHFNKNLNAGNRFTQLLGNTYIICAKLGIVWWRLPCAGAHAIEGGGEGTTGGLEANDLCS